MGAKWTADQDEKENKEKLTTQSLSSSRKWQLRSNDSIVFCTQEKRVHNLLNYESVVVVPIKIVFTSWQYYLYLLLEFKEELLFSLPVLIMPLFECRPSILSAAKKINFFFSLFILVWAWNHDTSSCFLEGNPGTGLEEKWQKSWRFAITTEEKGEEEEKELEREEV